MGASNILKVLAKYIDKGDVFLNIIIDQEFKSIIPALSDDELSKLEESILAEGCRDALILWGDVLVDGHNRYEICQRHGVEFKTIQMDFADREEAEIWILKNQFGRRNLTDVQRGRLALKYKNMLAAQAKEQQKRKPANFVCQNSDKQKMDTKKEVAKIANLSHDTIHKIESVDTKAPEPVKKAMEDKIISINRAHEITKATEKDSDFKEKLKEVKPKSVNELYEEGMKKIRNETKEHKNILNFWSIGSNLNYTDEHFELLFSNLDEDDVERHLKRIDETARRVLEIQKNAHKFNSERKRLKLVKF